MSVGQCVESPLPRPIQSPIHSRVSSYSAAVVADSQSVTEVVDGALRVLLLTLAGNWSTRLEIVNTTAKEEKY